MSAAERRILIVDDDPDIVESVASFLEAHGYSVLKAYDGRQGVRLAKAERPDLVILDVMMSERTEGFFAAQEIRRTPELAGTPIFILTSIYEAEKDFLIPPERAWLAHDDFLSKPVQLSELLAKIRQRLGPAAPPTAATLSSVALP